jgi:hypothetical protein
VGRVRRLARQTLSRRVSGHGPRAGNVNFAAFRQVLLERGYTEGQNLTFEYRSASGRNASFADLASELVSLQVDVIVTRGTPAALAARSATATIPLVMAAAGDPLAIARSPIRPAQNMTGFGASARGAERKRVEILQEMLPKVSRIAAITNLSNPSRQAEWREVETAARSLSVEPRASSTFAPLPTSKGHLIWLGPGMPPRWWSAATPSSRPIKVSSFNWLLRIGCPPSTPFGILSTPVGSCPMGRACRISIGALRVMSTKS